MDYLVRRRKQLSEKLAGMPVVLLNGWERPRNYAGNPFPFRPDSHFVYFCGVMPAGAALVLADGEAHLFVEPVTLDDAVWCGSGLSWDELAARSGATVHPFGDLPGMVAQIGAARCAALPGQDPRGHRLFAELLGRVPDPERVLLDRKLAEAVVELRLYADEAARAEMRSVCAVNVRAQMAGLAATRVGGDARDVNAAMQSVCVREGMGLSFEPIISTHGEYLHQPLVGGRLDEGDLLLVDFGVESDTCWAGDITNTWPVSGEFTREQREIYQVVLNAHKAAAALVVPGTRYRDVHVRACLTLAEGLVDLGLLKGTPEHIVERNAHALFFPHGIGHLLGLDAHDMEDLGDLAGYAPGRQRSTRFGQKWLRLDRDLADGMICTIEPGLYFVPEMLDLPEKRREFADCVNWDVVDHYRQVRGVRIERDYLVLAEGQELLTPGMPTEVDEIAAAVGKAL